MRWDGASQLAEGHKWASFPSAAIAWRMDQEDFLKDISWLNQLKLRIGMGVTGNAQSKHMQLKALSQAYTITGDRMSHPWAMYLQILHRRNPPKWLIQL